MNLQSTSNIQSLSPSGLKLILPNSRNLAIEGFQTKVENIIMKVRTDADRTGTATPVIILFSETSLRYVFNITPSEIHRAITKIQQNMPSDLEIAVGFSAFELMKDLPQNRGYLFTSKQRHTSFKRHCTGFDSNVLIYAELSRYKYVWKYKGREMEDGRKKFASVRLNDNLRVELRVCFDVIAEPIVSKPKTLTIVPAHNLDPSDASRLSDNRYRVVINDDGHLRAKDNVVTHFNTTYRNTYELPSDIEV